MCVSGECYVYHVQLKFINLTFNLLLMLNSKLRAKGQLSAVELAIIIPVVIIAIVIFIALAPNYSYSAGSEVNTFQLNAMAQSLLQYIVSNPGNPPDWGLNASQLSAFGLAIPNQPYHLDPFKVLALTYWDYANGISPPPVGVCTLSQISSTGFQQYLSQYGINQVSISGSWLFMPSTYTHWMLNYTLVKQLLGLGRDYEFMLVITPVFNITASLNGFSLIVHVTEYGTNTPVGNAEVSIQYYAIDQVSNDLACQYGILTPCTPAPPGTQLPPASTFSIISTSPLLIEGSEVGYANTSGVAVLVLPITFDQNNAYFIIIRASIGGLADYTYYQYPSITTPLLLVGMVPFINQSGYNSIVFADPHLFTNCLLNSGVVSKPSTTALGLRIVAVYKSLYGYTFESINFTLNPGRGANSYPVPCTYLQGSQANNYAACYWNLPSTPMLIIVNVVRNSQGQSGSVPLAQTLIIPYGLYPNYLMSNKPIVFGRAIKDALVGTATSLVYIGDSAYYATLYLYYGGNQFEAMG